MYKTVRRGEAVLQYRVLGTTVQPQRTPRRTTFLLLLTLILGCGIVVAAVLLPGLLRLHTFSLAPLPLQGRHLIALLPVKDSPGRFNAYQINPHPLLPTLHPHHPHIPSTTTTTTTTTTVPTTLSTTTVKSTTTTEIPTTITTEKLITSTKLTTLLTKIINLRNSSNNSKILERNNNNDFSSLHSMSSSSSLVSASSSSSLSSQYETTATHSRWTVSLFIFMILQLN